MRAARGAFIALMAAAFGTLVTTVVIVSGTSPVSLTILSLSTNLWSEANAERMGRRDYLCAVVGFKNASSHPVTYLARYRAKFPEYRLVYESTNGWQEQRTNHGSGDLQYFSLAPSQSFTFRVVLESGTVCKVALDYAVVQDSAGPLQSLFGLLRPGLPTNEWNVVRSKRIRPAYRSTKGKGQ